MNNSKIIKPGHEAKVKGINSITTRLVISFVSLFIVFLISSELMLLYGLPYTKHSGWMESHRIQAIKQLDLIADLKKQQMKGHLYELATDTRLLAGNPFLRSNIEQIKELALQKQHKYKEKPLILKSIQQEKLYQDISGLFVNAINSKAIYENFMLADIRNGQVFMASNPEDFALNVSQQNIFIRTKEQGKVYFNDINEDRITLLPVFQIGQVIKNTAGSAVAILILDVHIQKLLLPFLHTGAGLGETGETLLINEDTKILTPLKYSLATGEKPQLMQYKIMAKPAMLAAQGFEGVISSQDYRGVPVLAAYRNLWVSSDWSWGMVVKIDRDELFKPIQRAANFTAWVAVGGMFFLILLTIYLTYRLTFPIKELSIVALEFAKGNYAIRSKINRKDELGVLARSFNFMANEVELTQKDLERKVEERTSNLKKALLEQRQAEKKVTGFANIVDQSLNEIYIVDDETLNFIEVNAAARKNTGYSLEEFKQKTPVDINPEFDIEKLREKLSPLLYLKKRILHFNTVHQRKDGTQYPVEINLQRMLFLDRQVYVAIAQDITEREQMELSLRRSQKMEAMGNLTGGIAHDFNNLLAIVQGNLEILDRELPTNEKLHKRVNAALAGVHRGADITKKLLKFSRPKVTTPTILSLNETIADMEVLIAKSVMKRCSIQLRLTDALWLCKVNQGDFQDALLNLVINARDAMTGGGSVLIETANKCLDADYAKLNPEAEAGEYVQISVSDTGCGMSHKILEQVFEPFFTTKEMGEGTGLGLSMVYGFIKRSQGHIKLYSEVGHGTTVHLYLPRALQEGAIAVVPKITEQVVLPQGHETVLVVDDEEALLELASHFLLELGYKVLRATCGSEALEVLSAQKGAVDLMFSDIVMPGGMDGFALATKVVELYPEMSVLLTSGFSDKAVRLNGLAMHHVKLLDKPYSKQELLVEVRRILDSK